LTPEVSGPCHGNPSLSITKQAYFSHNVIESLLMKNIVDLFTSDIVGRYGAQIII
jgi:hypothetical protein